MARRVARVRPGRGQSAFAGIVALGMALFAGTAGAPAFFVVVVLVIAAVSFYNAFSEHGIADHEIEYDDETVPPVAPRHWAGRPSGRFCTSCGAAAQAADRYCGGCGTALA